MLASIQFIFGKQKCPNQVSWIPTWPRDGRRRPSSSTGCTASSFSFFSSSFFSFSSIDVSSAFFHVLVIVDAPWGIPQINKTSPMSISDAFVLPISCVACSFGWFAIFSNDFGDAKNMLLEDKGNKNCVLAKNELWQSWDGF